MQSRWIIFLFIFCVSACGVRELEGLSAGIETAPLQTVFFATQRNENQLGVSFGTERQHDLRFGEVTVSIPPNHVPGHIEWRRSVPDAEKEFAVVEFSETEGAASFVRAVHDRQHDRPREILLYVHGFNTTASEAVFRLAQIQEDFGLKDPGVLFTWPSAGLATGYVYDRDSVLFARDDLVAVLDALTSRNRRVVIVGHSMGAHLTMEALRQARLSRKTKLLNRISAVVLMSPDIDIDVFRRQADAIGHLPQPFLILAAKQDRALSVSSGLTGRPRLGHTLDQDVIGRDDVTILDFSNLADGAEYNHLLPVTSSTAIDFVRSLTTDAARVASQFSDFLRSPTGRHLSK